MTRRSTSVVIKLWTALLLIISIESSSALATSIPSSTDLPSTLSSISVARQREVVIVGGGPVGLAAALTLSNPPHSCNVIILETTHGGESVAKYDPTKAYLYNVNPRGLQWVDQFPKALAKLQERGTWPELGMGAFTIIPADPEVKIPGTTEVKISGASPTNTTAAPPKKTTNKFALSRRNTWVPRHQMVGLLLECCKEQEAERLATSNQEIGSIQTIADKEVESLEPNDSSNSLRVHCKDGSCYEASLVVAADGINSTIRSTLADKSKRSWLQSKSNTFQVKKYKSPATGLRLKVLQFPPNFTIPDTDGESIQTTSTNVYVFRGVNKGTRNYVSLGLLPVKDPNMIRPANTITRYNHEIWQFTAGKEAKEWFQKCFPRVDFDALFDDAEWERYVKAKGTTYPYCQYSPGSAVSAPDEYSCGVVLVGDACHAFPPDIGQGINSGLQDVIALDRALKGEDITTGKIIESRKKPESLGAALANYQRNRKGEHRALIRLARFGAPYQYKQSWHRDRIGRFLWTANFLLRTLLNKWSFGLIPTQAITLASNASLTFRQVMRRADTTAFILKAALLTPMALWVIKRVLTFIS
jgi:kynurenine 3-monooxygenase